MNLSYYLRIMYRFKSISFGKMLKVPIKCQINPKAHSTMMISKKSEPK